LRDAIEKVDQAQVCALLCDHQTKPFARGLGIGNAAAIGDASSQSESNL
jgi:hypothetical protein